jgi:superfamily I DNA/RNA helicase
LSTYGQHVVLGTAGSGKTTLAIIRAAYLADAENPDAGRTLLVTFNRSLVTYLNWYGGNELQNVDVRTFPRFAIGYLSSRNRMRPICEGAERSRYIRAAIEARNVDSGIPSARLAELVEDEFDAIGGQKRKKTNRTGPP